MSDEKTYAIIQTGGKQYCVRPGDVIEIEKVEGDAGSDFSFKEVLFWQVGEETKIGQPLLDDCLVKGELLGEIKGDKKIAFKFKRRKNYRRKIGHRQTLSRVKITSIE